MNSETDLLPPTVSRPLWRASFALLVFLGFVVSWATLAPLSTTVRVNGAISSSLPSHEIQNAYGGRIAQVFVRLHDHVEAGSILFQLDTRTQDRTLAETQTQISQLLDENRIIAHYVDPHPNAPPSPRLDGFLGQQYRAEAAQVHAQQEANTLAQSMAQAKLDSIDQQLEILQQRLALLQTQAARQSQLADRGVSTQQQAEQTQDRVLAIQTQIETQYVEQITLHTDMVQAENSATEAQEDYKRRLLRVLNGNLARLPDLRKQEAQLFNEIEDETLRAPVAGTVVDLSHGTADLVAARGQTLARLAQRLDAPSLELMIPTALIDQVHTGMTGQLTILALPQRSMPKIEVELTDISPEAQRDPDEVPTFFPAKARISRDDLDAARQELGDSVQFSSDMPVSVALEGRRTTFGAYLFGGFLEIFQDGLQD